LGTNVWADAQRRLAHLLYVAVKRRGDGGGAAEQRTEKKEFGGPLRQSAVIEYVQGSTAEMIASAQ